MTRIPRSISVSEDRLALAEDDVLRERGSVCAPPVQGTSCVSESRIGDCTRIMRDRVRPRTGLPPADGRYRCRHKGCVFSRTGGILLPCKTDLSTYRPISLGRVCSCGPGCHGAGSDETVRVGESGHPALPIQIAGGQFRDHRHVCGLFEGSEPAYRTLLPFIADGLSASSRVPHRLSCGADRTRLERLAGAGIDVEEAVSAATADRDLGQRVSAWRAIRSRRDDQSHPGSARRRS